MNRFLTLLSLLLVISFTSFSQSKNFLDQPYIEVFGEADTLITPDEIYIRIAISEKDTKDKQSVEDLEIRMVEALKKMNLDVNLKTTYLTSRYKYSYRGREILKTKEYLLMVKSAPIASSVFVELESIGISNTNVVRVEHSRAKAIKMELMIKASENAKEKANSMAKPLNKAIGNALLISELIYNPKQQNYQHAEFEGMYAVERATSSYNSSSEVDFEKIKIAVMVSVKFELK